MCLPKEVCDGLKEDGIMALSFLALTVTSVSKFEARAQTSPTYRNGAGMGRQHAGSG